jgi:peptide/nickel transport system ATP-binding protein
MTQGPDQSPASWEYLLEVRGLRSYFFTEEGVVKAVDDISFKLAEGEVLGLVGESGCGKTVTSLSLMRLLSPPGRIVGGEVIFKGRDLLAIPEKSMRALRGSEIAMVFQEPASALNPVFTIGYQVGEALMIHKGASRREAVREAVRMLEEVAIPDPERRVTEYPHQLSGGMRQRVMLAMALICGPRLLIADEPTTALDVTIQAQILDLMLRLRDKYKLTVLLITHDFGVVAEMADRVAVMYAGKIVETSGVKDLFKRPLHPYTAGLLKSIPGAPGMPPRAEGSPRARLSAIEGAVPNLLHLPRGCAFNPRCPDVMPHCHENAPALLAPADLDAGAAGSRMAAAGPGGGRRQVACFKYTPLPEAPPPVEGRGWDPARGR